MINFIIKVSGSVIGYIGFLYYQDPIGLLGLTTLFFYTYFTFRLWTESVYQTGISLMPIPAFYFRNNSGNEKLRIRNLGNKPMFNIKIEDWNLHIFGGKEHVVKWKLKITVPFPNIIEVSEERDLKIDSYLDNILSSFEMWPHLHPEYANFTIPLKVTFQDIRGITYKAKFSMGKGGLSLLKPPKKYNVFKIALEYLIDILSGFIKYYFSYIKYNVVGKK